MTLLRPPIGFVAGLAVAMLAAIACTGRATPAPDRPGSPLAACTLGGPGAPTAPPGYALVAPGTIAFTQDAWHDVSGGNVACGAQAVRGVTSVIAFSSLSGEDRIFWVATLARQGQPTAPDPVLPTMTLFLLDPGGRSWSRR